MGAPQGTWLEHQVFQMSTPSDYDLAHTARYCVQGNALLWGSVTHGPTLRREDQDRGKIMSTETDEYWLARFQEKYGRAFRQGYFSDRDDMKRLKAEQDTRSVSTPESATEAPKRPRGRPKGTTQDPLPTFAENVATDDSGHLVWIGARTNTGQPQMWFKKTNRHGKYVAYCLLVEDVDYVTGDRYVSDCGAVDCVHPDCLYLDDPDQIVSLCGAGKHQQDEGWTFTINGHPFCRACEVFYLINNGHRKQIGLMMGRAGILRDTPDRAELVKVMYDELVKYPSVVIAEAERALIDYEAWVDETPDRQLTPDRVLRFQALMSGDFSTLLADVW